MNIQQQNSTSCSVKVLFFFNLTTSRSDYNQPYITVTSTDYTCSTVLLFKVKILNKNFRCVVKNERDDVHVLRNKRTPITK